MGISAGKSSKMVRNKYVEYRRKYMAAKDFSKKLDKAQDKKAEATPEKSQDTPPSISQEDPIKKMLAEYQSKGQETQATPSPATFRAETGEVSQAAVTRDIVNPKGLGVQVSQLTPSNSTRMQRKMETYKPYIRAASARYNLPEELIAGVIWQESRANPRAVSHCGAMGLMQLMPGTAKHLGVTNAFHPGQNIDGGAKYLRQMLDKFGRVDHAIAAYNAGPGNVQKYGGIPPFRETRDYVPKVLGGAHSFRVAGGFQDNRKATAVRV